MSSKQPPFVPIVCVVDFHHARGPEVETWIGAEGEVCANLERQWPLLSFMALSDGAHAATEDFSYFTLRYEPPSPDPVTSLFGIACTRQLDARELIDRPADVTRSTVQKAVVTITDSPQIFGALREKLGFVTKAWFAQKDFTDTDILKDFQSSVIRVISDQEEDGRDQFFGASLREVLYEWRWQTLTLFKCLLLQPKMLFFGSHCEKICMLQFALISLVPGLIRRLQDCADPALNGYEENFVPPTSLKTSERASLLAYVGLPLHLFGKGSFFGPYTPLQQLDMLADDNTKSYVVGSTNSLLLAQRDKYSDILVNLDERTLSISDPSLRAASALTTPDRRWIDFLTQTVLDTWDEDNPSRPNTHGYAGSEEFIRLQFEEYLLALLSAVKYKTYVDSHSGEPKSLLSDVHGEPVNEFGVEWLKSWQRTEAYRIFNKFTDSHIFDVVEPHHPCSGGLTVEDVQRRLASQVAELHLDERLQAGRDTLNKHLASGQQKVSTAFNNLWNDIEVMREKQRKRMAEQRAASSVKSEAESSDSAPTDAAGAGSRPASLRLPKAPDLTQAQANIQAAGAKAGAYLSSWGAWAAEKKSGWARSNGARNSGGDTAGSVQEKKPGSTWAPTLGSRAYEEEKEKRRESMASVTAAREKEAKSRRTSAGPTQQASGKPAEPLPEQGHVISGSEDRNTAALGNQEIDSASASLAENATTKV